MAQEVLRRLLPPKKGSSRSERFAETGGPGRTCLFGFPEAVTNMGIRNQVLRASGIIL
jgi:hypothetical protein